MGNDKLVWMGKYGYMSPIEAEMLKKDLDKLGVEFLDNDNSTNENTSVNATSG